MWPPGITHCDIDHLLAPCASYRSMGRAEWKEWGVLRAIDIQHRRETVSRRGGRVGWLGLLLGLRVQEMMMPGRVQFTEYSIQCTVYRVQFTEYRVQFTEKEYSLSRICKKLDFGMANKKDQSSRFTCFYWGYIITSFFMLKVDSKAKSQDPNKIACGREETMWPTFENNWLLPAKPTKTTQAH